MNRPPAIIHGRRIRPHRCKLQSLSGVHAAHGGPSFCVAGRAQRGPRCSVSISEPALSEPSSGPRYARPATRKRGPPCVDVTELQPLTFAELQDFDLDVLAAEAFRFG